MSATFATPKTPLEKQAEGLDILSQFLSLNKDSVKEAGEETRRQMQLTSEEKKKVDEARAFIAQHASLDANLKKRENELTNNKTNHELEVKQHIIHVESENIRLETFAAQLALQKKQQEEINQKQIAETNRLAGLSIDMERQHLDKMAQANKLIEDNKKDVEENRREKSTNIIEAQRLKDWESTLKAKAQRLREQAANF